MVTRSARRNDQRERDAAGRPGRRAEGRVSGSCVTYSRGRFARGAHAATPARTRYRIAPRFRGASAMQPPSSQSLVDRLADPPRGSARPAELGRVLHGDRAAHGARGRRAAGCTWDACWSPAASTATGSWRPATTGSCRARRTCRACATDTSRPPCTPSRTPSRTRRGGASASPARPRTCRTSPASTARRCWPRPASASIKYHFDYNNDPLVLELLGDAGVTVDRL